MSEIEWTDTTWNPVAGCNIMSEGCSNCYAMHMAYRLERMGVDKYKGVSRRSGKKTVWTGKIVQDEKSLKIPLKWKKPRKVFVNSMSDLFHENVECSFIKRIWDVMKQTPQHNYQILTKRPDRMREFVTNDICEILPNVWLGTSVESKDLVPRIDDLSQTPAAIRFISFEPLIASVGEVNLKCIDWAIVGGESGPSARPIEEVWIDEIYHQCKSSSTSFFFKQWGAWGKDNKKRSKKQNGRVYKGKIWDEMPALT